MTAIGDWCQTLADRCDSARSYSVINVHDDDDDVVWWCKEMPRAEFTEFFGGKLWSLLMWFGGIRMRILGLLLKRTRTRHFDSQPGHSTLQNDYGQVVHMHVPTLEISIIVPAVLAKGRCHCVAGKVTVCLASHWMCVSN